MDYLTLDIAILNKKNGIDDYLKSLGKLYVTPFGPFTRLADIAKVSGIPLMTCLRRIKSKKKAYEDWYLIYEDCPLSSEELCKHCDKIDNMIFEEGCWLYKVYHDHSEPVTDDTLFEYSYKGYEFTCTVGDWKNGLKPHEI